MNLLPMTLKINIQKILFLLFIFSLFSCNLFKRNITENKNTDIKKIQKLVETVNNKSINFKTFSANFFGKYSYGKQNLPLNGIIKIRKDSFIWISVRPFLGIELARILLSRDTVKYINKIEKTYSISNYKSLKKKYGFDINYKIIESLLTNKLFLYPDTKKLEDYKIKKEENKNYISSETETRNQKFIHTITIENDLLTETDLKTKDEKINLLITYEKFSQYNNKLFPEKLNIFAKKETQQINTEITYKKINFDKEISAKFKIPSHYKKIQF